MSKLKVTTLATADDLYSVPAETLARGACRAWVNFAGTTTPPTIRASFNVSSVVRNGAGNYTINFTNAMVDANYSVNANAGAGTASDSFCQPGQSANQDTNNVQIRTTTAATTPVDRAFVFVSVFR